MAGSFRIYFRLVLRSNAISEMMGIRSVAELAKQESGKMYDKLCKLTGQRQQDPCVLDTFEVAVAQAVNPRFAGGEMSVVVLEQKFGRRAMAANKSRTQKTSAAPKSNRRTRELTTPDLVLLSLLCERPWHAYDANQELQRRQVGDWAGVSRPQVYYSFEKLKQMGLLAPAQSAEPIAGPERNVMETTAKGREALADALERDDWTIHRDRPPFVTWMALSWRARSGVFKKQVDRRRKFLEGELAREQQTL